MRESHKPLFYNQFNLRKATKSNLFEKLCLYFIEPVILYDANEGVRLEYKTFRGKMYIISESFLPPVHWSCRCNFQTFKNA